MSLYSMGWSIQRFKEYIDNGIVLSDLADHSYIVKRKITCLTDRDRMGSSPKNIVP